jgi:hypothetical protein
MAALHGHFTRTTLHGARFSPFVGHLPATLLALRHLYRLARLLSRHEYRHQLLPKSLAQCQHFVLDLG